MEQTPQSNPLKRSRIIIPIVIGLGFVCYMFFSEFSREVFDNFDFTFKAAIYIALAFVFMAGRDLGYVMRLMLFARGDLGWMQALKIIMLWEFTSAVTPSTVGGTSVAVVFVHKEGLSVGKSATMVMLTAFFDELFFAIIFPLVILLVGGDLLFGFSGSGALMPLIIAGYCVKVLLVLGLSYGLFVNPRGFGRFVVAVFSLPLLRRWRDGAVKASADIELSSQEIKHYRPGFWIKAFGATSLSWISRFMVANALFMAFFSISDQLLVFARQLAMWVPMIISPTPGGSGFAEYIFQNFLSDVIPVDVATQSGTAAMIALLWRGVTYYPYLIIGAVLLPRWIGKKFIAPSKNK